MSVKNLTAAEAMRLSDLNLAAYLRHVNRHAEGSDFVEEDGFLLFAGAHPNPQPYVNGLLRLDTQLPAEEVLERARAFFGTRKRGYAVWIRDHADADLELASQRAGYWQRPPLEGQPAVFIDHVPPAEPEAMAAVRRVETREDAIAYLDLVGQVYDMGDSPRELIWAMFLTPEALLAEDVAAFVAVADGRPIAGCMTYVAHELAGMFWAVRARDAEGHGLGAACAAACVEAGLERGAVVASGQGSARGTPLWVSLGWEVLTNYRRYLAPPPASGVPARP
jgi:hypothetical protein